MTRIIAGTSRGRRLRVPSVGTRPTSDRIREALFSTLDSMDAIRGTNVLDLYAGSGALGLEAVSRGATTATLVDSDRGAVTICQQNALTVAPAAVTVVAADVVRLSGAPYAAGLTFDLVFLDPPYEVADAVVAQVLEGLAAYAWLAPSAQVVIERTASKAQFPWPSAYVGDRRRDYGGTALWYGHLRGSLD
ncbi:MAG: 16S rRNA (guanine(966)-N(2))-methyltransferase RsmD [Actinomycetes bacterium]